MCMAATLLPGLQEAMLCLRPEAPGTPWGSVSCSVVRTLCTDVAQGVEGDQRITGTVRPPSCGEASDAQPGRLHMSCSSLGFLLPYGCPGVTVLRARLSRKRRETHLAQFPGLTTPATALSLWSEAGVWGIEDSYRCFDTHPHPSTGGGCSPPP